MSLTIGSLCTGYGGLDLAVESVFGARTVWVCENEKPVARLLAKRFNVPNLGDMTAVDWETVPPVDIICGGTPCQDLSLAGKRQGMSEGTRSNLWAQMREAIAVIKPRIVVWENVRGAYSVRADSAMEHAQGLLGEPTGRPTLRALGRVLGDLADLGFDARWVGIRAADAGAPHNRLRVFVFAWSVLRDTRYDAGGTKQRVAPESSTGRTCEPSTRVAADTSGNESELRRELGSVVGASSAGEGRDRQRQWVRDATGCSGETPTNTDQCGCELLGRVTTGIQNLDRRGGEGTVWGAYEPSIRRWERKLQRLAPPPRSPQAKRGRRVLLHRLWSG